jgi:hypothetical protein
LAEIFVHEPYLSMPGSALFYNCVKEIGYSVTYVYIASKNSSSSILGPFCILNQYCGQQSTVKEVTYTRGSQKVPGNVV